VTVVSDPALQVEFPAVGFTNRSAIGGYSAALRQAAALNVTSILVICFEKNRRRKGCLAIVESAS